MKTQSGRSMIEMLGVLAIIGVLSIGGLAGYTRAMNAYQANQIMDYFNRCSVAAQEEIGISGSLTHTKCLTTTTPSAVTGLLGSDASPVGQVSVDASTAGKLVLTADTAGEQSICDALEPKDGQGVAWTCTSKQPKATYDI